MGVHARIDGEAAFHRQPAIFQEGSVPYGGFQVDPPQPNAIHAARHTVRQCGVKVISRGDRQELRVDVLLVLIEFAHIIACEGFGADALDHVINVDTAQVGVTQGKLREDFEPGYVIRS